MFQVGDKIVHPMHGAGIIDSIVQKKVNGVVRDYYILKLPVGGHSGPPLQTVLGQGGIYARLNIFITGILREHNL